MNEITSVINRIAVAFQITPDNLLHGGKVPQYSLARETALYILHFHKVKASAIAQMFQLSPSAIHKARQRVQERALADWQYAYRLGELLESN